MADAVDVLLFDPLTAVPYYDASLASALAGKKTRVQLAAITYYLDRSCFSRMGVENRPGWLDIVGRYDLPRPLRRCAKLLELAANLTVLFSRFRKTPPAVVHVQFLPLLRTALPLDYAFVRWLQRRGSKFVYTVHDLLPHDTGNRFFDLYARVYAQADTLICHTASAREELIKTFGIDAAKIHTIPHGPLFSGMTEAPTEAIRKAYHLSPHNLVVLWQGLIFPYKGLDFLLDSWPAVIEAVPHARLIIAGTGDPELLKTLQQKIENMGLQTTVRTRFEYISAEELGQLYTLADCVAFPYKAISTSGALMTAMSFGKAIVATDLPYFKEILKDGELGSLVPYGNTSKLSSEIASLLLAPAKRQELQDALREQMDGKKQWEEIAVNTLDCYRQVQTDTDANFVLEYKPRTESMAASSSRSRNEV